MILVVALTTACSPREEPLGNQQESEISGAPAHPVAENAAAGPAAPAVDPRSAEAAVAVLRDYFRLMGEREFVEAHKLWSGDDLSDGAFADRSHRRVEVAVAGDHQHREAGVATFNLFEKLESVQLRPLQPDVEQHQAWPAVVDGVES